jgi:hypothetical protein
MGRGIANPQTQRDSNSTVFEGLSTRAPRVDSLLHSGCADGGRQVCRRTSITSRCQAGAKKCRSIGVGLRIDFLARIRRSRSLYGLLVALCAIGVWRWEAYRAADPARATQPFRVGFVETPPYNIVAPDGSPSGPYIDIFQETCLTSSTLFGARAKDPKSTQTHMRHVDPYVTL